MAKRPVQQEDGGSIPLAPLHIAEMRFKDDPIGLEALERFKKDQGKCFQRHIREVRGEKEKQPIIENLNGAVVESITTQEASEFIKKYEWLKSMGRGTMECVGIRINGKLSGVECFGKAGGNIGAICRGITEEEVQQFADETAYLMRGASAPWAPKKTGSYLIKQACRLMYQKRGWKIFFAYSDADAGEIGIVYQRAHWHYLGTGLGKGVNGFHSDFLSPDGTKILTSYYINHNRKRLMKEMDTPSDVKYFRRWLRDVKNWREIKHMSHKKGVYVWFEGTSEEVKYLKSRVAPHYLPFKEYPKREQK